MRRRRFLMIAAAALAAPASAEVVTWQAEAMGGEVRVDLRGPRPLGEVTARAVARMIDEVEQVASLFRPESTLNRLNRAGSLRLPQRAMTDLLQQSDLLHRETGGLFDPSVQPLWRAMAEGGNIQLARARVGWPGLARGGGISLRPGQALTLNGIAQGYAADRVREILLAADYGEVLVDMGEFTSIGGPFTLGVEDPEAGLVATRSLNGGAIATSSPGAMRIGEGYHILGPRGETPLWSTVSVEAASATLADGLSTAGSLMEPAALIRAKTRLPGITRITTVSWEGEVSTF